MLQSLDHIQVDAYKIMMRARTLCLLVYYQKNAILMQVDKVKIT